MPFDDYEGELTGTAIGSLVLMSMNGVGSVTVNALMSRFKTLGDIRTAELSQLTQIMRRVPPSLRNAQAWNEAVSKAENELNQANVHGVQILGTNDLDYPVLLRNVRDRPPVLYVKGTLQPGEKNVACVGTVHPSNSGIAETQRIVSFLANNGWSIVSGLALGIDTESHRQALRSKGHTVAVLAGGLDSIFPRENQKLAEEILEHGGALISEQPFEVIARAGSLIQRDRIQCGMSTCTIAMQTGIRGGTMHTVGFTVAQQRKLLVPVPQGLDREHAKCEGIIALLEKTGSELAQVVEQKTADYLQILRSEFRNKPVATGIDADDTYEQIIAKIGWKD
jgi:DNA processing protein